ncbi:helix-turn-helix transcriptional regulator [Amycolatopsis sp. NPDC088138]|uniref:helix-turn-helix transcriptional regulator n=1 Tax=Amycolatopsis sp. NPDC088138 TaxID=3363938 RepID=UPI0038194596
MPRMTVQTGMILEELIRDPAEAKYGLELMKAAHLKSGTVYQILARLEGAGWLTSEMEDPAVHVAERRPRRRLYRLTAEGAEQARRVVSGTAFRHHSSRARRLLAEGGL